MTAPARTLEQRIRNALRRLENDVDAWVATADPAWQTPYLIPLSFLWDGQTLLIATPGRSSSGRNLQATGRVRLGIGPTRDVILIDGRAEMVADHALPAATGDRFAARTGFDPRILKEDYRYFRICPRRVQAWREANERDGRDLMRDGRWLVG